jgi:hypothetical protein
MNLPYTPGKPIDNFISEFISALSYNLIVPLLGIFYVHITSGVRNELQVPPLQLV